MYNFKSVIAGAGYISGFHIDAIRRTGIAEVCGIYDVDQDLAAKKSKAFNIPIYYKSFQEILDDNTIDIVHNCTPNNLHYEINSDVIRSGKHIFSEKPLAMNSQQGSRLVELLKNNPEVSEE